MNKSEGHPNTFSSEDSQFFKNSQINFDTILPFSSDLQFDDFNHPKMFNPYSFCIHSAFQSINFCNPINNNIFNFQSPIQATDLHITGPIFASMGNLNNITPPITSENLPSSNSRKRKQDAQNPDDISKKKQIRRERNREHAKHSRFRRKFLVEQLETVVVQLKNQNNELRKLIYDNMDEDDARKVLAPFTTTASSSLLADSHEEASRILDSIDYPLIKTFHSAQKSFVIAGLPSNDSPIMYVSKGFMDMTGYSKEEIIGHNCRFLQGPETDSLSIQRVRNAITTGTDIAICLKNYRKDGSPFWNQLFLSALKDDKGVIVAFIGVQCLVTDDYAKILLQTQSNSIS